MKKCFNNAQTLKSSEDCKKFSKSVSYETLVIGAATIGTGIKQTQRLIKGTAGKPLSAVGTLTSLLCNSAKVMALSFLRLRGASGAQGISAPASCREAHKRRFLFNSWILRFANAPFRMTIPALALLFTLITTAESWAIITCGAKYSGTCEECYYDNDGNPTGCKTYYCGYKYSGCNECSYNEDGSGPTRCKTYYCGYKYGGCSECYYNEDGSGPTGCKTYSCGYKYGGCSECSYNEDGSGPIACIECDSSNGYILCGGRCQDLGAYNATSARCDEATGNLVPDTCQDGYILCGGSCKPLGMYNATSAHCDEATGNLVPDTCNRSYVLCGGSCKMPLTAPYVSGFACNESTGNVEVTRCGDYNPAPNVVIHFKLKDGECVNSCGEGYIEGDHICHKIPDGCESASATDGSCTKCSAGLSFDDDNNCIECNKKGYKNVGGYCNRIQYTPAEAALLLHNDNTNSVTITFRK